MYIPTDEGLKVNNLMDYSFFLTPVQKDLLLTEEVGRLYTLKQLSFCYVLDFKSENLGYISATHSRLEHSVITADYARYFFHKRQLEYTPLQELTETSALLHDIGHTACSHAFEKDTKRSQEQQVKNIIFGRTKNKGLTVAEVLENHGIDKKRVFDTITEQNNNPETLLISEFCDRLAYIVDDSHRCHTPIQLDKWKGGALSTAKSILEQNLEMTDKELFANLKNVKINEIYLEEDLSANRAGEYVGDSEWISFLVDLCISRTELFINVYGAPSNSKCVTLARNAAQIGQEEGWLRDDDLYYLGDEPLMEKFVKHKSTRKFAEQIKTKRLPDTALAIWLNEGEYNKLVPLKNNKDKRLEFEEKIGGLLDINPLSKWSVPKINFVAANKRGTIEELFKSCPEAVSYKAQHDAYVTRRLVVYANPKKDPEKVAQKAVSELGLEMPEDLITLRYFFQTIKA